MDLQALKAACARVAANSEIGTGYLVAADLVATCEHVVKSVPDGGPVSLKFHWEDSARTGRVLARDRARDCALVRLEAPLAGVAPLPLGGAVKDGDLWQTFGYPVVVSLDGDAFVGVVRDVAGRKGGRTMLELFCDDTRAGRSPKVSGLSGAPVLVSDRIVGHVSDVRTDALRPDEAIWGRIYAVPAADVIALPGFSAGVPAGGPGPRAAAGPAPSGERTEAERRFEAVQQASRSPSDAALVGAELLLDAAQPAAALERLRDAGDGRRAVQLRALALARTGRKQEAVALLEPLLAEGALDAETGGILGGRYKQLWLAEQNPTLLARSFRVYLETWQATRDVYPGVNALATALWLRREAPALLTPADAEAIARAQEEVARRCAEIGEGERDGWRLATRAEVHLLAAERDPTALNLARKFYALAAGRFGDRYQNLAVARRQARRTLGYLALPDGEVDALLPVPGVMAFTGHMTDAPGRPQPRFPATKVRGVRAATRAHLAMHRVGFGFSSAARGSDLLFLEEVLDRGGRVHVFLPFPVADFKRTSVSNGWNARFDGALAHPRATVAVLRPAMPPDAELTDAYAACNRAVREAARAQAELLDQPPRLLAVWNRHAGDGPGGAADAVAEWLDAGLPEPRVVDPAETSADG